MNSSLNKLWSFFGSKPNKHQAVQAKDNLISPKYIDSYQEESATLNQVLDGKKTLGANIKDHNQTVDLDMQSAYEYEESCLQRLQDDLDNIACITRHQNQEPNNSPTFTMGNELNKSLSASENTASNCKALSDSLLNNIADSAPSAIKSKDNLNEQDNKYNALGVNSLATSPYSYQTNDKGYIKGIDYAKSNAVFNHVQDELNNINHVSNAFSAAQKEALKEQCPITKSTLWYQVVNKHGKDKLGKGEVMLPELDPMHVSNHSYQLVHSLYNICNEGYLRFDALSEGELIRANQGEISTLLRRVDGSTQELNCYLIPLIKAMVRCCSIVPASMYHHHDDIGGLIRHNLQVANECLDSYKNFAHSKITVANKIATLTEQREAKKQAQAAYFDNLHKQANLQNHIKCNLDSFKQSIGLIDDEKSDLLNFDLDIEEINDCQSQEQQFANMAKAMGLMLDKSFDNSSLESLSSTFDNDLDQSSSTMNKEDIEKSAQYIQKLKNDPNLMFNDKNNECIKWDSLNLLQRAQAFGLINYVEDEQLAALARVYSGDKTDTATNLNNSSYSPSSFDKDPYLVGLGKNIIGATTNSTNYNLELAAIKLSLFEDAFVKKMSCMKFGAGCENDYNSNLTKEKKDIFGNLICQIRMEAERNNQGRFDRYQLDLIIQLAIIFVSFAHDLGKITYDMEIYNDRGARYNPHLETLANFAEQTQTQYLYLRYISARSDKNDNHNNHNYSGLHLLSVMCPDLVALIYQVIDFDHVISDNNHPLNKLIHKADALNCAKVQSNSTFNLKGFAAYIIVELIKSRLRADALAQMQIARIKSLAKAQGLDLSADFDFGYQNNSKNLNGSRSIKDCDFDNIWHEVKSKKQNCQASISGNDNTLAKNNSHETSKLSSDTSLDLLDELLKANVHHNSNDEQNSIHQSVQSFREQMSSEQAEYLYPNDEINSLKGQTLYHMDHKLQSEANQGSRLKALQEEQYKWAIRIFKSSRRSLSVNELGSDLYVEGANVVIEQESRALSTLNMAYQNYYFGNLAEQNISNKQHFRSHVQLQNLSETYMKQRSVSWFAIAVGDDLVILKGIDLRLTDCDFGSDVAIINLGTNNHLIEELTLDLANYILNNIRLPMMQQTQSSSEAFD